MSMKNRFNIRFSVARRFLTVAFVVAGLVLWAGSGAVRADVETSFLYTLSNFSGPVPYNWGRVFYDKERNESYVLYQNTFRVFNASGMEIYRFGEDVDLGLAVDAAVDREGNILVLAYRGSAFQIVRCNFRGEPGAKIGLKNLPGEFSGFSPNRLVYRDGKIYLAALSQMKIVIATADGAFQNGYAMAALLDLSEKERRSAEMAGFSVDREGNILFTIPVLFKAFKLSIDQKITAFGKPGSAPGLFSVVSGIVADSRGNYLVADKIKSTVMVFDSEFNFLTEFGYRGAAPQNLIRPESLAIDGQDRVYVTQGAKRGVNVYRMIYK